MSILLEIENKKKLGDTANTVQIIDCNPVQSIPNLEKDCTGKLAPSMLTLIEILARQAAREICGKKEGE